MTEVKKLKHHKALSEKEKEEIALIHFWDEDVKTKEICEKYGMTVAAYKKVIDLARTDKIVARDNQLLELVTFSNIKFAQEVSAKKRIPVKEMEMLDKLANSAMKRIAVARAAQEEAAAKAAGETVEPMNIQVKF